MRKVLELHDQLLGSSTGHQLLQVSQISSSTWVQKAADHGTLLSDSAHAAGMSPLQRGIACAASPSAT